MPEISFDNFNPIKFADFIYDFLKSYGFINIQKNVNLYGGEIDFTGDFLSKNPFGQQTKEAWVIETKFYSESRFDIKSVNKLINNYRYFDNKFAKVLLITNSQLTSVVEEHLDTLRRSNVVNVNVIDGLILKKLVARKTALLTKHFPK
jgi:hypothetical protein